MTEHRGTSFYNSCVKVPIDPYSRQPTPSYERIRYRKNKLKNNLGDKKINFEKDDKSVSESETSSPRETVDSFLEFLESIPDYGQVHHLSNEQFKQKVDYLKKKQNILLKNLQNSFDDHKNVNASKCNKKTKSRSKKIINDLTLNGKKCYLEESRTCSPVLFHSSKCNELFEDRHLLTNRKDKEDETAYKEKICLNNKKLNTWNDLDNDCNIESDIDSDIETQSLPASVTEEWHPTVPKPFSFTLRNEVEKYMTQAEKGGQECKSLENNKKNLYRKRRIRPVPLTSKLPLYDKLLAEKEERSRIIREESALNLMSQVRPFRLECDRRAWRFLARSNPEIRSRSADTSTKFKAKPVPKNLFSTEVYDRMLEDEYYRQLQKKVRATQLMKSSSLPPSMARRERFKSTSTRLNSATKHCNKKTESKNVKLSNNNLMPLERCESMMSFLPLRGNNLAAILRCQVSREKLEREIREKMEEKRREQAVKLRESLIGRSPVWRALRSAARHEHERDLSIRTSLRRDEAREQAERYRLQMEMMLDRVTQIPTLFERHSQSYQSLTHMQQKTSGLKKLHGKRTKKHRKQGSSSADSYMEYENVSRSDSGSLTSSSGSQSTKSSNTSVSQTSEKFMSRSQSSLSKKKGDRSRLKVSINETAQLIEEQNEVGKQRKTGSSIDRKNHDEQATARSDERDTER